MIPEATVTGWGRVAPWPLPYQIEQDLLLSRIMIEIASHERLGKELAMRGGTCFHKLCLDKPARYSEDLDYVRVSGEGPIGEVLDDLRGLAEAIGFSKVRTGRTEAIFHSYFHAEPTTGPGDIRIKVDINTVEWESFSTARTYPHRVASDWWSGEAAILAFEVEELMATKLRALYGRNKGRDLFDLWLALVDLDVDEESLMAAHVFYMDDRPFTYRQLRVNLLEKLKSPGFRHDLDQLVVGTPQGYDIDQAADLVMERLGARLANAPEDPLEVADGAWRR